MLKKTRILAITFMLGVFLSFGAIALAASTISPQTNFSSNGKNYSFNTGATSTQNYIYAYSPMTCSTTPPYNYMGISTYLYNSSGTCVANSEWVYNSSEPFNSIYAATPYYSYLTGYFYAKGYAKAYNGNGYDYQWGYSTSWIYYPS